MFKHAKIGDRFTRMLGGEVPMEMEVSDIQGSLLVMKGGWTFDSETGAEVDDDLQWGPAYGVTGSYLKSKV